MNNDLMLSFEFIKAHPLDAARILERFDIEETNAFLKEAPPSLAATVIKLMDLIYAAQCLEKMGTNESGAIIVELSSEIASTLLRRIDHRRIESILEAVPQDTARELRSRLRYSEGTAGALMDSHVFTLPEDITIEEGLNRIRKHPQEVMHYIYVVNRERVLVGFIDLRELILSDSRSLISVVMHTKLVKISVYLSQQAILMHPGWAEFHALPVVDHKGIFLGAIDHHTLRKLESNIKGHLSTVPINTIARALGELYWIGLSGLIKGAAFSANKK
ncbi:MAG: CBS domain-containing protein [Thermodesulfobacteriota bacterium]|nr:CBS domain-containing protein [Thermodesulfobacteriota bacterium]